jgi:AcrR family transcriptional regulator
MPANKDYSTLIETALKSALELAGEREWNRLTLKDIAAHAGLSMSDFYGLVDKDSLTDALESWADKAMSSEDADMDETPRERLFDVVMRRFETMEAYRAGVIALMHARERAPARLTALVKARTKSARWALSCAGLDQGAGVEQTAKILGIAWAIGKTERAWRKDDAGDFARTMATLDAELTLAEERYGRLQRFGGANRKPSSQAKPEETSSPEAPRAETGEA